MPDHASELRGFLRRYDRMSTAAAHQVITSYSTSFSLATRLLSGRIREDIRNLYAMVRIADEIVDGTAEAAGLSHTECVQMLDDYERAVLDAPRSRFHVDPVLHAYAQSARRCSFDPAHIEAFFASMRRDLTQSTYDSGSFDAYVYGSAEVIGLLCLAAFLVDNPVEAAEREQLDNGARALGAAFQKVNFLRDLAEDSEVLGRAYFPGLERTALTEARKDELVADIRNDLDQAHAAIGYLPMSARAGVLAAANLFAELTNRIDALPAEELARRRVSVPSHVKARIIVASLAAAIRMKAGRS
ncbi:All-trans-phytoene synthase [Corynebacterium atrinae]|uniref:phytoene/squalene synthase family protein n=1 Tax=Corynebacterium atrinae TaxID=1336740 RepID=UPI0025B3E432|nr:phytoene/squalene synthase family protein [Corynebacterium atrinae]WJY62683.1 All-trans-phytoene synthase [Corynebacterium atrinae]